ncbi:DUF6093 family protein [Micromonospora sp. NPDC048935]|uniref:DUF6093 family protein n=1 Tax=Micromonospora sp. NPDC048935 TaxID=3364262 RepID=UPI0037228EE0
MPLPNTHLIHPRFEQHHRPVADKQATAECRVERPAQQAVWDDAAGKNTYPPPELLYEGPCRYQYLSAAGQPVVADTTTPLADVRITLPVGAVVYQTNDLVTLTATATNPDLLEPPRTLTVVAVSGSSISWQRDLVCQLRQPTTR